MRNEGKCGLGHRGYRDDGLIQSQHKFGMYCGACTLLWTWSTAFQYMVGGGREALEHLLAKLKTSLRVSVEGVDQIISAIMHHDGPYVARICVASRYLVRD